MFAFPGQEALRILVGFARIRSVCESVRIANRQPSILILWLGSSSNGDLRFVRESPLIGSAGSLITCAQNLFRGTRTVTKSQLSYPRFTIGWKNTCIGYLGAYELRCANTPLRKLAWQGCRATRSQRMSMSRRVAGHANWLQIAKMYMHAMSVDHDHLKP